MGAGQEDLRAARLAPHVVDIGADAVAGAEHLARDQFVAPHDRLARAGAAEIDHDVAVFDPLDRAVDDVADAVLVDVILLVALGLADLLHQHLLGGLGGDASVVERRQRFGDPVADLGRGVLLLRLGERDLRRVVLDLIDDEQQPREPDFAGFRIDLGADFGLLAVARARGLLHRVLHRREHDRAVDRFFPRDRVDDLQEFKSVGANGHCRLLRQARAALTPRRGPRLWVFDFVLRLARRIGLLPAPRASRRSLRVLERRLLAPQRGADEVVGQYEPRLGHGADRQLDLALALVVGDQRIRAAGPSGPGATRLEHVRESACGR